MIKKTHASQMRSPQFGSPTTENQPPERSQYAVRNPLASSFVRAHLAVADQSVWSSAFDTEQAPARASVAISCHPGRAVTPPPPQALSPATAKWTRSKRTPRGFERRIVSVRAVGSRSLASRIVVISFEMHGGFPYDTRLRPGNLNQESGNPPPVRHVL